MSQLGLLLQEPLTTTTTQTESRTILGLLREEQMDGLDDLPRSRRRRRSFKERLGFIGFGCCGTTWGFRSSSSSSSQLSQNIQQQILDSDTDPGQDPNMCLGLTVTAPTSSGSSSSMNLAAALAAERQLRGVGQAAETGVGVGRMPGTPWRVSLMRLLEETENGDTVAGASKVAEEKVCSVAGNDSVCCVCMGRNKGAAFIPCGHTFCRVCSRELWLNRGSCPLCNRSILEILDIF